tara:strand:+ start:324 stop:1193 length:870 start_codon:yes stop_codon:yes gene_type:complete
MRLYSLLSRIFPRSYLMKIFLIAFIGVHIPLIVFIFYVLVRSGSQTIPVQSLSVVLVATLLGTAATLLALRSVLSPLHTVAEYLTDWSNGKQTQSLPVHYQDALGQLMRVNNLVIAKTQADLDRSRLEADTDPLTGLWNRRGAERQMENSAAGHFLLLDIDHFKSVNDVYGHDTGDEVLVEIANELKALLRPEDMIARFGGEEFVVFISGPDRIPHIVAEQLRSGVANRKNASAKGQTVSIGVAPHSGGPDFTVAIGRADRALYDAKHQGRNKVCTWIPDAAEYGVTAP